MFEKIVRETVDRMAMIVLQKGYLPELEDNMKNSDFDKVGFWRGAVGAIPMFCLASEVFSDVQTDMRMAAEKLGQIAWVQGLTLKGNGLKEGITGIAYAFHCISRLYNYVIARLLHKYNERAELCELDAEMWRMRAFMFAKALFDTKI
jgi:hypothetical protein